MKVLAVSSPHTASTRDVWKKLVKGLEMNGVQVQPYDLVPRVSLYEQFEAYMKRVKRDLPETWSPITLAYEPILGAALHHECDMVIIVSPQYFPNGITDLMNKVGIQTAAYFTECPYEDEMHMPMVASSFNYALVSDLSSVGLFQSFTERVLYVPHSYDPAISFPPEDEDARIDRTVFVGTAYSNRINFFSAVDWPVPLEIHGGRWKFPRKWHNRKVHVVNPTSMSHRKRMLSREIGKVDPKDMSKVAFSVVEPEETAELYRTTATSFSLHRAVKYPGAEDEILEGAAYSLSPRNWELAACRTFQVSDYREELVDVFGDTVPLYETPAELAALLRRAIDDPQWRKELAYRQCEKAQPFSCGNVMRTVAQFLAA